MPPVTEAPAAPAPVVAPAMPAKASAGSMGTMLAIILVLAIVIIGALYFWGERLSGTEMPTQQNATTTINLEANI